MTAYSIHNPYAQSALLLREWKDVYFILGDLDSFAQATAEFLKMKRKAQVWEMTALASRPLNWIGGR